MNAKKLRIKLYAEKDTEKSLEPFIPLFHSWIQKGTLGEMVYDVADYTHVPEGTGVLLVGHASDYAIDQGQKRPGLLYSRKRDLPADTSLVKDGLKRALHAAHLLNEAGLDAPTAFGTTEILFTFPDRLHLQNDAAGFSSVEPDISAALFELMDGAKYQLSREGEPREPLTVRAHRV